MRSNWFFLTVAFMFLSSEKLRYTLWVIVESGRKLSIQLHSFQRLRCSSELSVQLLLQGEIVVELRLDVAHELQQAHDDLEILITQRVGKSTQTKSMNCKSALINISIPFTKARTKKTQRPTIGNTKTADGNSYQTNSFIEQKSKTDKFP